MTEKEWRIIGEEFISYTGGYGYVISNGDCRFCVWERKEDVQKVCDKLSELAEENIKQQTQVKKVLKKQLDYYTERALLLNQPYDDVTEAIYHIAGELGVDL